MKSPFFDQIIKLKKKSMFDSIWQDVRRQFSYGNAVTRLVIVNIAVFVAINVVKIVLNISNAGHTPEVYERILHFFCLSSHWQTVVWKPWTILTSLFLHEGFGHVLWNMLFLYWFGRIVGDLIGDRHILPMYLICGLGGGLAFFLSANFYFNYGEFYERFCLGASGAIMGIVLASAILAPDYEMHLLLIGPVKLKYVVAVLLFLDLISISENSNTGGHFAHIGGALTGWFYISRLRDGSDWSVGVNRLIDWIRGIFGAFSAQKRQKPPRPKVFYKNPEARASRKTSDARGFHASDDLSDEERVDQILDKIRQFGIDNLSPEERDFLNKASKK